MERAFIATKYSKYYKDLERHFNMLNDQKTFIRKFFKEQQIESHTYRLAGDGFCNVSFEEEYMRDIYLYIQPTEQDLTLFGKFLGKPNDNGLCKFKGNSKIAKEFARQCVDKQVIINIYEPSIGDYFYCLALGGYSVQQYLLNDLLYVKIESERLNNDELPDGFKEIKLSEFYSSKEEYENNK